MGQASQASGREKKEEEEKEITPAIGVFLDVWSFLQSSRRPSMGEQLLPIPADAILAYCHAFGWFGEDRYILIDVVRALDDAYTDHHNKKGKGKLNAKRKKGDDQGLNS